MKSLPPRPRVSFLVPFLALVALVAGACSRAETGASEAAASTAAAAQAAQAAQAAEATNAEEAAADAPPSPDELLRIMSPAEADASRPRGVVVHEDEAFDGYTIVAPLNANAIHLVDMAGEIVHTWPTDSAPGAWCYLLDDGTLLRAGREDEDPHFRGGGIGGRIQKLAPDGTVLWRYQLADENGQQHHDLEPLPNGNVLLIAWERKSAEEAIARGRHPEAVGAAGLWPDAVYEVRPTPPQGGEIVWAWHAWDHLVQDVDPEKPSYGSIADHPERIDVNAGYVPADQISEEERREQEALERQMADLGYAGGDDDDEDAEERDPDAPPPTDWDKAGDWLHTNAVDYHAELDLIVLSSPELCEIFVIDHSTTTAEAASSSGGRQGRGGDILWRWGNPATYGHGTEADQRLFYQHDPTWVGGADDLRLLVFNNGGKRPDGDWSSVDELALPFERERGFVRESGEPWGPATPSWSYSDRGTFFSAFISGAQRLPNGNTLVCSGAAGRLFELTRDKEIVWDFLNPYGGEVKPPDHAGKAPPLALFRGARVPADHPGVAALRR